MSFESFNNPNIQPKDASKKPVPATEIPKHLFSKDPHEVLNVPKTANVDEVEKARKDLQRKFHPDINKNPSATEASKKINIAFDTLNNPSEKNQRTTEEKSSDEAVSISSEIEVGILVPYDFFVDAMEFGKLRNVRVNFFLEKETFLSKIYKVEFKGKRKDIQMVADYIRNRPKVKF